MSSYAGLIEGLLHEHNSNFGNVRLLQKNNESNYDSILIYSEMTAYRPKVEGALFGKIKENGKRPYIAFRMKYRYWFDDREIPTWNLGSDKEFFRVDPIDFLNAVNTNEDSFGELAAHICADSMSFPKFGCCSKYQQCSDIGKCVHEDLLYSSACEYRRNLEAGHNFYIKPTQNNEVPDSSIEIDCFEDSIKRVREFKGKSLIDLPSDFTVIDIETTGLDTRFCDIIEVGAVKIRDNKAVDSFDSLINVGYEIDDFITELTGITNEMLQKAPDLEVVLKEYIDFIGEDIIVGHNVNFDINFIYDSAEKSLNRHFGNDFIDTLRLSRRLLPDLKHHRLADLVEYFNISIDGSHRALVDCMSTYSVFRSLSELALSEYGDVESLVTALKPKKYVLDISAIKPDNNDFDISHPLYGRECVFTGTLEKMKRADAMKLVVNVGGLVADRITKKTNFLVLGNNDFRKSIKDGKSNKQKKAEALKIAGQDIDIISEYTFYEMIEM